MRSLYWGWILGGSLALATVLTACATPAAQPTVIEATPTKEGDQVTVQVADGAATLDVTSKTGIGGAAVEVVSGPFPTVVVFRLHLKGLEQFTLSYGTIAIRVAVASDGSDQAWQSIVQDGVEEILTPDSPYWMPVAVTVAPPGADNTGLPEKTYALTAPPDFLKTQPGTFVINWIDFFR